MVKIKIIGDVGKAKAILGSNRDFTEGQVIECMDVVAAHRLASDNPDVFALVKEREPKQYRAGKNKMLKQKQVLKFGSK